VPAQFVNVFASERDRCLTLLSAPTPLRAANNNE
jgi:hypothetical protein